VEAPAESRFLAALGMTRVKEGMTRVKKRMTRVKKE
jgi:hypothetical protein